MGSKKVRPPARRSARRAVVATIYQSEAAPASISEDRRRAGPHAPDDEVVRELMRLHGEGCMTDLSDHELPATGTADESPCDPGEYGRQIADASRRFQELFQGVPIACFCFDAGGRIIEWNRACERLFHLPVEMVIEKPAWEVVGRAVDKEITRALVMSVVSGHSYEGYEWQDEYQDGLRYFLGNVYPLRAQSGEPTGGISASIDITLRKHAEQALQESEERWYLAVRGNNDGIWDWNLRTGQTYFSARCSQMLGYDEEMEIASSRQEWLRHVHPDVRAKVDAALKAHLERKTDYYYAEYRVMARDGSIRWLLDRGQALWNRNGEALRIAGSFTDITERKRYEEQLNEAKGKLEELATRDGLTGLKNRRAFQERFDMEFERCRRYGLALSVVMIDVDNFKQYNDTYGHPAGDAILGAVASLLEEVTRDTDFVARYGGEEFILLLPHTTADMAMHVAERCRARVECHPWPLRHVTASFGVATMHAELPLSRDNLLQIADEAMYVSKVDGRNRVTHAANMK